MSLKGPGRSRGHLPIGALTTPQHGAHSSPPPDQTPWEGRAPSAFISAYSVPGTVLRALSVLSQLFLMTTLFSKHQNHPHFTQEETEAGEI